jgi:hypothetical protein
MIKPLLVVTAALAISPAHESERDRPARSLCAASPLVEQLDATSGQQLLSLYGYDLRELWACTSIPSPRAPGAQILRFKRISTNDDDHTAFTVLKPAGSPSFWIIPTTSGMLSVRSVGDPHNRAAFNALLRSMPGTPSSAADWEALARLYLAVVEGGEAVLLKIEDGACAAQGDCSLSFADRVPRKGLGYWKRTVSFDRIGRGAVTLRDTEEELVSVDDE